MKTNSKSQPRRSGREDFWVRIPGKRKNPNGVRLSLRGIVDSKTCESEWEKQTGIPWPKTPDNWEDVLSIAGFTPNEINRFQSEGPHENEFPYGFYNDVLDRLNAQTGTLVTFSERLKNAPKFNGSVPFTRWDESEPGAYKALEAREQAKRESLLAKLKPLEIAESKKQGEDFDEALFLAYLKQGITTIENRIQELSAPSKQQALLDRELIISCLLAHHGYCKEFSVGGRNLAEAKGYKPINGVPIGLSEIFQMLESRGITRSKIVRFFNTEFNAGKTGGHSKYVRLCDRRYALSAKLSKWSGDAIPREFWITISPEALLTLEQLPQHFRKPSNVSPRDGDRGK